MQGLTLTAITAAGNTLLCTLVTNSLCYSHWSVKSRSNLPCHIACLKSMLRTISMQGIKTHNYHCCREMY